jgi:hypothetical protein
MCGNEGVLGLGGQNSDSLISDGRARWADQKVL